MVAVKVKSGAYIERLNTMNLALAQILEQIQDPLRRDPENLLNIQERLKSLHKDSLHVDKGIWNRYSSILLPIQTLMKPKTKIDELKSIELEDLSSDAKELLNNLFQCFDKIISLETNIKNLYPEKEIPKNIRYINTEVNNLKSKYRGILSKFGFTLKRSELEKYKYAANTIIDENPNIKNSEAIKRDLRLNYSEYESMIEAIKRDSKERIRRFLPYLTTTASELVFVKAEAWYNSSLEKAMRDFDYKVIGTGKNRLNISEKDAQEMIRKFGTILEDSVNLLQVICILGIAGVNHRFGKKFLDEGSTINRRNLLKRISISGICSAGIYTTFSKTLNSLGNNNVYKINIMPAFGENVYKIFTNKHNDPKRDIEVIDEGVLKELKARCTEHCSTIYINTITESLRHGAAVISGVSGFYKPEIINEAIDFSLARFNR